MSAATTPLPPVPYQAPISDKTLVVTPIWSDWLRQVAARVSALVASSIATSGNSILKGNGIGGVANAVAADFPILNQSTTGNASTVTTNANLTGDVTSIGNATTLSSTSVTPGAYTSANITVDAKGRITAATNGSGGGGGSGAYAALEGATVPYSRFGQHMQTATQSLTAVNIGLNNTGGASSTVVVQLNQLRSGSAVSSATASITLAAGVDGGTVGASLSGTLSLLSGDKVTFDCNSVTGAPEWLTVEY